MQFFVFGKPQEKLIRNWSSPEIQELVAAEFAKSREYYSRGVLRQISTLGDSKGVVCIFETDSLEQLHELVAGYPLQEHGYVKHEIYAMQPYPGFVSSTGV